MKCKKCNTPLIIYTGDKFPDDLIEVVANYCPKCGYPNDISDKELKQAIRRTAHELANMSDEDFAKLLKEHANGSIARLIHNLQKLGWKPFKE